MKIQFSIFVCSERLKFKVIVTLNINIIFCQMSILQLVITRIVHRLIRNIRMFYQRTTLGIFSAVLSIGGGGFKKKKTKKTPKIINIAPSNIFRVYVLKHRQRKKSYGHVCGTTKTYNYYNLT